MKNTPALHLEPRCSVCALTLLAASHGATALLLLALPLPVGSGIAGATTVVLLGALAAWRLAGRRAPALLVVGVDGRIVLTTREGRTQAGSVLAETYVGRRLTTIAWRPEGARWSRTMLILADTLPADDFRRLRVVLRYCRAVGSASGTSGVDAGLPASHA